jgi:hypothetical protein
VKGGAANSNAGKKAAAADAPAPTKKGKAGKAKTEKKPAKKRAA